MRIAFRTDASLTIGTGHVMRCLTLADALHEQGASVRFICREHEGHPCDHLTARGYEVIRLPVGQTSPDSDGLAHAALLGASWLEDAEATLAALARERMDWLIVDHYALDVRWEMLMRPQVTRIMVIDDLADRYYDCDLLLDQNLSPSLHPSYRALTPPDCHHLLGPHYALLRPQFAETRHRLGQRDFDRRLRHLLVFLGGTDPHNETAKALAGIRLANLPDLNVDVVIGSANPYQEQLTRRCKAIPNAQLHVQVDNMAALMARADLALGAGGSATWERCCLGLPTLGVILAENQAPIAQAVAVEGAQKLLGWGHDTTPESYAEALHGITMAQRMLMSEAAIRLCDGNGTRRVADSMFNLSKSKESV